MGILRGTSFAASNGCPAVRPAVGSSPHPPERGDQHTVLSKAQQQQSLICCVWYQTTLNMRRENNAPLISAVGASATLCWDAACCKCTMPEQRRRSMLVVILASLKHVRACLASSLGRMFFLKTRLKRNTVDNAHTHTTAGKVTV